MFNLNTNFVASGSAEKLHNILPLSIAGEKPQKDKRIVPTGYRLFGLALNAVSKLNSEWAAEQLSRLWFRVFKRKSQAWVQQFWSQADACVEVSLSDKNIPVYLWGNKGPLVVFMHGWSGSGTQFRYFIPLMLQAGFRVAVFDAPGHGQNTGKHSHLLEFCDSLVAIQNQIGPVHCVVAHSLGAMAATLATHRGLHVNQLVLLAPHLDVEEMFQSYSSRLNLRKGLVKRFKRKVGEKMAEILQWDNVWDLLQPEMLIQGQQIDGLLVFDKHDEEVSLNHFEHIQSLWKVAESLRTEELGHVRLLKDTVVIQTVVEYLQAS